MIILPVESSAFRAFLVYCSYYSYYVYFRFQQEQRLFKSKLFYYVKAFPNTYENTLVEILTRS